MSKIIANGSKMNNISHPVEDVNHSLISGRVLPDLRFLMFKDGYSSESLNIRIYIINLVRSFYSKVHCKKFIFN